MSKVCSIAGTAVKLTRAVSLMVAEPGSRLALSGTVASELVPLNR
jgi:hypothetical protein